jgi:ankyrin repeat protein
MRRLLRYVGWALALGLVLLAGQARQQRLQAARTDALFRAIHAEQPDVVAELLEQGTRPDVTDEYGAPALCRAAACSDPTLVKLLLGAGAAVDQRDADYGTPLMQAVGFGQPEVARELLAAGADVNAADHQCWTPLHVAANHNRPEMINTLVRAGARTSPQRSDGATPLKLALKQGFAESAVMLRQAGAVVSPQDRPAVSRLLARTAHQPLPIQGPSRANTPRFRFATSATTQGAVPRQGRRLARQTQVRPGRTITPSTLQDSGAAPNVIASE